jgi:hypothetical protein
VRKILLLQLYRGSAYNSEGSEIFCRALLQRLAPEHKFATAAKLCGEVVAGFAEGTYAVSEASEVLRDALCILSWPEIRVGPSLDMCCGD